MDVKVYKKEDIIQEQGTQSVFVPDAVDFIIQTETDEAGNETITGALELNDDDKDYVEQACTLASIWQRGLDPLDVLDGIQWSEVILGEINVLIIIEQITEAVGKVSTSASVQFDTVKDASGNEYFSYKISSNAI